MAAAIATVPEQNRTAAAGHRNGSKRRRRSGVVSNRVDGSGSGALPLSLAQALCLPGAPNNHTTAPHRSRTLAPSSPTHFLR